MHSLCYNDTRGFTRERLDSGRNIFADRAAATGHGVGVVSVETFDATRGTRNAPRRPRAFPVWWDQAVPCRAIPLHCDVMSFTHLGIRLYEVICCSDAALRFDPRDPRDGEWACEPVFRREGRSVIQYWRNVDDDRQAKVAARSHLHYRSRRPTDLNLDNSAIIHPTRCLIR